MILRISLFVVTLLPGALGAGAVSLAAETDSDPVQAELLSESAAVVPGQTAWLGIHLQHAAHWHTYWTNPGDSGLTTKISWTLPEGYAAGDIAWPRPQRFQTGELYNFGYDGDLLLPVPISVPAAAQVGTAIRVDASVKWLACREECLPGKASFSIPLAVAAVAPPRPSSRELFLAAHAMQPAISPMSASAALNGTRVEIHIDNVPASLDTQGLDAFPVQSRIVANTPPKVGWTAGRLTLIFDRSDYFASLPERLDLVLVDAGLGARHIHALFAAPAAPLPASP